MVQALGVQPPQETEHHPVISSVAYVGPAHYPRAAVAHRSRPPQSRSDLQETFGHYFKQGSAAERYVADVPLFERLGTRDTHTHAQDTHAHVCHCLHTVAAADAQASAVYSAGGNAALMANRLAELGTHFPSRLGTSGN